MLECLSGTGSISGEEEWVRFRVKTHHVLLVSTTSGLMQVTVSYLEWINSVLHYYAGTLTVSVLSCRICTSANSWKFRGSSALPRIQPLAECRSLKMSWIMNSLTCTTWKYGFQHEEILPIICNKLHIQRMETFLVDETVWTLHATLYVSMSAANGFPDLCRASNCLSRHLLPTESKWDEFLSSQIQTLGDLANAAVSSKLEEMAVICFSCYGEKVENQGDFNLHRESNPGGCDWRCFCRLPHTHLNTYPFLSSSLLSSPTDILSPGFRIHTASALTSHFVFSSLTN